MTAVFGETVSTLALLQIAGGFFAGVMAASAAVVAFLTRREPPRVVAEVRPVPPPAPRPRAEIETDLARAVRHVEPNGLRVTHVVETDPAGATRVKARVVSGEGSADVVLSGDDLRSEPAIRFQLLGAWSGILRDKSRRLLGDAPEVR